MSFKLVKLVNIPIFDQLRMEEALLRTSSENWCLINSGSCPSIVMGISGKPEKLLDLKKTATDRIPVIKRFSGGGTVYIDAETVFVTFIFNHTALNIPPQPHPILKWSESFYSPIFKGFSLKENDYVFGEKKFAGNAQYIQKGRWLLHTSFLWSYDPQKMDYLLLPEKRPHYRGQRGHSDFLCTLQESYPDKNSLIDSLFSHAKHSFNATITPWEELQQAPIPTHRMATSLLNISEYLQEPLQGSGCIQK